MDEFTRYEYSTPGTPDSDIYDSSNSDENNPTTQQHTYNLRSPRRTSTPSLNRRNGGYTTPSRLAPRSANIVTSPLRRRAESRGIKPTPPRSRRGRLRKSSTPTIPTSSISGNDFVKNSAGFLKDILGIVIWLIRKPLAWALAVVILYVLVGAVWVWFRNSMYAALSPLCSVPGMGSVVGLPFCEKDTRWNTEGGGKAAGRDFPRLIDLQTHFEGVLENSVGGSVMAMDLKNSEIAVRDLNSLVKHSKLMCREDLSNRLEDFVSAAKSTSRQLSKFSSRVGGVVDNLLAMDEFAIRALENVQAAQIAAPTGLRNLILSPFQRRYDVAAAEREVLVTFVQASIVMDTSIRRLIHEAEIALRELDALESKLNTIEDIVQRENGMLDERHQEVLAQIWTILGGNRGKLVNFESHKYLLSNISVYRKRALALVSRSLIQLQTMQSNLEELRDRVAEPGLLDDVGEETEKIPLEVHIQSIRKGVDRLSEGMSRAKGRENDYMKLMLAAHDEAVKNIDGPRKSTSE